MESLGDLKQGDLVAHRSNTKVTMVIVSIPPAHSATHERNLGISCTWLSTLHEPQIYRYNLFELVKV